MKRLMQATLRIRDLDEKYGWLAPKGVLLQIMAHLHEAYTLPEPGCGGRTEGIE